MTNTSKLIYAKSYKGKEKIFVGDTHSLQITHTRTALLQTRHGNLLLNDVLVVPNLKKYFFSISQLTNDNSCF